MSSRKEISYSTLYPSFCFSISNTFLMLFTILADFRLPASVLDK